MSVLESQVEPRQAVAFPVPAFLGRLPGAVARPLAILLLAFVFYRASSMPIWHLDTWSHWKYGEWIWQHGRVPDREPFSPYSDAQTPLVDTWWLSQVVCYSVYTRAGMEGIALFYGLVQVVKTALYLVAFRRMAGSLFLAVVGVAMMQAGVWEFVPNFRPQMIGEVCWAGLLAVVAGHWSMASQPLGWRSLLGIALCVGLWANLHGAFLLAYVLLGRSGGPFPGTGLVAANPSGALRQPDVIRLAVALVVAIAAACVNPYGTKLLTTAIRFGNQPVLQNVKEWQPRTPLETYGSVAFVVSVLVVLATVRLSRAASRRPTSPCWPSSACPAGSRPACCRGG